jgi:battenin
LVPPNTPKGIIAFCNIFPALIAKLTWPYILRGTIRYTRRIVGCSLLSILGMIVSPLDVLRYGISHRNRLLRRQTP